MASATVEDATAANDAADAAFADWARGTPRERSEVLRRAWELMTERAEDFARLRTLENGKARTDAMGEATYAAEFFRWFAEEAVRADGRISRGPTTGARIIVEQSGTNPPASRCWSRPGTSPPQWARAKSRPRSPLGAPS